MSEENREPASSEPPSLTFDFRDEFNRRPVAEKLIRLLASPLDISPVVIDGRWGTGKTEFCHKLINLMEESHPAIHCAYVDAFKADHADEPLATLVAAVANLIDDETAQSAFIKKAIPAVRFGVRTVGKAGFSWLLKQSPDSIIEDFQEVLEDAGEESIDAATKLLIRDHQKAEENLEALRNALRVVATTRPLIVFIDELDRCRPDFAVSVLENVKHVFDVDGVQFVLLANMEQLKNSVNHSYGATLDAQRYLDKFLGYSFRLSSEYPMDPYNYYPASKRHVNDLIRNHPTLSQTDIVSGRSTTFMELIELLVATNQLSLREVETFVLYIGVYDELEADAFPERIRLAYGLLRILAVYYFCFEPKICEDLLANRIEGRRMAAVLGVSRLKPSGELSYSDLRDILAGLIYLESTTNIDELHDDSEREVWAETVDEKLFREGLIRFDRGERISKIMLPVLRTLSMSRYQDGTDN